MGLNGYYVVISIYGWAIWRRGANGSEKERQVSRIGWKLGMLLAFISIVAFVGIGIILDKFTDSPIPYWDAFTTSVSFVATWMLARKILEHWILWIIVDAVSMGLYLYRELYPTLILFLVYTTMAVFGYFEWKKAYTSQVP